MGIEDTEGIRRDLAEINTFVRERLDPVTQQVSLLSEESERLKRDISEIQRRERVARRDALVRQADVGADLAVPEGPYAGLGMLDLALLRRFAYSQRPRVLWPGVDGTRPGGQAPAPREHRRRHDPNVSRGRDAAAQRVVHGRPEAHRPVRGLQPVGAPIADESGNGQHHSGVRR